MKPVRSSFPNALSPRRRRPSSVLVAACRAVAALPLSCSLTNLYIHTRHTAAHKGRGALTSLRPSSPRRCCGTSSEYVRPPTAPGPR